MYIPHKHEYFFYLPYIILHNIIHNIMYVCIHCVRNILRMYYVHI